MRRGEAYRKGYDAGRKDGVDAANRIASLAKQYVREVAEFNRRLNEKRGLTKDVRESQARLDAIRAALYSAIEEDT